MAAAETTIAIVGFPPDSSARELHNLCRLFPGFQKAQPRLVPGKPVLLFVKFETSDAASDVLLLLQDHAFDADAPDFKLKAEFAKNEMTLKEHDNLGPDAPVADAAQPQKRQPQQVMPPEKRPRRIPPLPPAVPQWVNGGGAGAAAWGQPSYVGGASAAGGLIDTLACKVPLGQTSADVQEYYSHLQGCVALKDNGKNCFVKFTSHSLALRAVQQSQADGIEVSLARGNMRIDQGIEVEQNWAKQQQQANWGAFTAWGPDAGGKGGGKLAGKASGKACGKGAHVDAGEEGPVDTIACKTLGVDEKELEEFFSSHEGFVKLSFKPKNCFVKFDSPDAAQIALESCVVNGFTASLAKFSMY